MAQSQTLESVQPLQHSQIECTPEVGSSFLDKISQ